MSIQTDTATIELKEKVLSVLLKQGYTLDGNGFVLENNSRENRRDVHLTAKAERMCENEDFIEKNLLTIKKYLVSGCDIEIDKIQPEIIEVVEGSLYEKIFKWWNLVW